MRRNTSKRYGRRVMAGFNLSLDIVQYIEKRALKENMSRSYLVEGMLRFSMDTAIESGYRTGRPSFSDVEPLT